MADSVSNLTDPLANVQQALAQQDNADLNQAVSNQQWASTFVDTPPPEVLRSRLNLASTMNRVIGNRLALAAQTDTHALDLMQKKAEFEEYQRQAPMREALLTARTDAAGAASRLQALKDTREAQHTANLSNGLSDLYQNADPSDPASKIKAAQLIVANPYAHHSYVSEVGKLLTGKEDLTPEQSMAEAKKVLTDAAAAGIEDVRLGYSGGRYHVTQGAPKLTPQEAGDITKSREQAKTEATLTRAKELGELKGPVEAAKAAASRLSQLERLRAGKDLSKDVIDYLDEEIRSVKARNTTAPTAGGIIPPSTPPTTTAAPGGDEFKSADEVRAAFKAGAIPREKAEAILKAKFGHT